MCTHKLKKTMSNQPTHTKLQIQSVLDSTLCFGIYYVILKLNIIFFTVVIIIEKVSCMWNTMCWISIKEGKVGIEVVETLKQLKVEYNIGKLTIPK